MVLQLELVFFLRFISAKNKKWTSDVVHFYFSEIQISFQKKLHFMTDQSQFFKIT